MHEKQCSVLYAGGLQFSFPGLGRFYLRDWWVGFFQFFSSIILVGIIWSWIDGYLIIKHQLKVRGKRVTLIYHEMLSDEGKLLHTRSPITASVLQLFCFGSGRIYLRYWIIGRFQLLFTLAFFALSYLPFLPFFFMMLNTISLEHKFIGVIASLSVLILFILLHFHLFVKYIVFRLIIDVWAILDSYCIFRGWEINPDRSPLNYSVAISSPKINIVSKDRFIAGIFQLALPGLGRCYLGYWWVGILQFLLSFLFIGLVWSWVDGHHILLNPEVDKDGSGELLTDHYRLNDELFQS